MDIQDRNNPSRKLKVNDDGSVTVKVLDNSGSVVDSFVSSDTTISYTQAIDYGGGTQPVYVGLAIPGTEKNESGWLIRKYTYSDNKVTDIQFAGSSTSFDKIWNNRAGYSYG